MKHVFIINSHTTFLTAIGTINYLKLSINSIILIFVRHYHNTVLDNPWKSIDLSDVWDEYPSPRISREKSLRNKFIAWCDSFVSDQICDKYRLYAPHYAHSFFQVFSSHSLCMESCFLQEGGIPFKNAYNLTPKIYERVFYRLVNKFFFQTDRVWMPRQWYFKGCLRNQTEIHSYAISDSFFKHLHSTNHIVSWPVAELDIDIADSSTIFIFDGFVSNGYLESNFYLECCRRMINEDASAMNYIRFHPAQDKKEKESICNMFVESNFKYEVMDSSIPFELIINSCKKKLKVAGLGSSLLFFARDLGHYVLCHDRWLSRSEKYVDYKKHTGFLYFDEL